MAKKSKKRAPASGKQPRRRTHEPPQTWRRKLILGGTILVLVIGLGVFVRVWQQSRIPPQLQGALDNHYTRGPAGAVVVMKEFSDFT